MPYSLTTNKKRVAKNQIQSVFGNIGLKGGSLSPYANYAVLTNSQQKRAAKNQIQSVFGNIGLKGGSLSPSVLTESELKRSSKLVLLRGEASESVPHFQTYIT